MVTDEKKSEVTLLLESILKELGNLRVELQRINESISKYGKMIEGRTSPVKSLRQSKTQKYSVKACYETLNVIRDFELGNERGMTADEIAKIRKLSRPTIYTHLDELEEAGLVFSRRGSNIGLEPSNASFYYVTNRELFPTLFDQNLFNKLTSEEQKVARKIITSSVGKDKGITFEELREQLTIENKRLEKILKMLLRRTLIEDVQEGLTRKYVARPAS